MVFPKETVRSLLAKTRADGANVHEDVSKRTGPEALGQLTL
jgi:hypothetical protein